LALALAAAAMALRTAAMCFWCSALWEGRLYGFTSLFENPGTMTPLQEGGTAAARSSIDGLRAGR
jgi:hypothetical protein